MLSVGVPTLTMAVESVSELRGIIGISVAASMSFKQLS